MAFVRFVLVGVCAVALLGAQQTATAAGSVGAASLQAAAASRHDTSIRFLTFDHVRGYGSDTAIRGQVAATVGGSQGAVPGARVKLFRKIDGTAQWHYLRATRTTTSDYPRFTFTVRAVANAHYRAKFVGSSSYQPSRASTSVSVYRHFHATLEDGTGRFHGRVTPDYASRRVALQKRSCGKCSWHRVRSAQTGSRGGFSLTVGAPRGGRWFWRVSTPATTKYIHSYSGVFTTRLR